MEINVQNLEIIFEVQLTRNLFAWSLPESKKTQGKTHLNAE